MNGMNGMIMNSTIMNGINGMIMNGTNGIMTNMKNGMIVVNGIMMKVKNGLIVNGIMVKVKNGMIVNGIMKNGMMVNGNIKKIRTGKTEENTGMIVNRMNGGRIAMFTISLIINIIDNSILMVMKSSVTVFSA